MPAVLPNGLVSGNMYILLRRPPGGISLRDAGSIRSGDVRLCAARKSLPDTLRLRASSGVPPPVFDRTIEASGGVSLFLLGSDVAGLGFAKTLIGSPLCP